MDRPRRIVLVSLHVPEPTADNAGVQYLDWLCGALRGASVTVIAPDAPANRRAMEHPYRAERLLVSPVMPRSGLGERLAGTARRVASVTPPVGFVEALIRDSSVRSLLREADVVDLEWPVMAPLVSLMRRLAPQARVIATLHDVVSQRYAREIRLRRTLPTRLRAAANYLHARRVENAVGNRADAVVVFSDKDRELLRRSARVTVVHPPLAAGADGTGHWGSRQRVDVGRRPTAVLVGPLTRSENLDAARWLVGRIWPRVRRTVPDARLRIVGRAGSTHRALFSGVPGVEVVGFVDDLDGIYAEADVVLAPLRLGAGVKFKVLDALARGIPLVATSVATEGIGNAAFRPDSHDDELGFANATVRALMRADNVRDAAAEAAEWVRSQYGLPRFERQVSGLYGLVDQISDEVPSVPLSGVSVVIPVRNGEAGIATQLEALAAQEEAEQIEVVVSDNGSTDRTVEVARTFRNCFQSLHVVGSGDRKGVSHARNVGAVTAQGQYVLFVDADDAVQPGYIAAMKAGLEDADIVGGVAIMDDGKTCLESAPSRGPLPKALGHLPYALGGVFGVRRDVLLALNGFDESFVGGHEEVDFAWRARQADYSISGRTDARLVYQQRHTVRGAFQQYRRYAETAVLFAVRAGEADPTSHIQFVKKTLRTLVNALYRHGSFDISDRTRAMGWWLGSSVGAFKYQISRNIPERQLLKAEAGGATKVVGDGDL